jgi:hypothetical protein
MAGQPVSACIENWRLGASDTPWPPWCTTEPPRAMATISIGHRHGMRQACEPASVRAPRQSSQSSRARAGWVRGDGCTAHRGRCSAARWVSAPWRRAWASPRGGGAPTSPPAPPAAGASPPPSSTCQREGTPRGSPARRCGAAVRRDRPTVPAGGAGRRRGAARGGVLGTHVRVPSCCGSTVTSPVLRCCVVIGGGGGGSAPGSSSAPMP